MVFTTACSKSPSSRWRAWLFVIGLLFALAAGAAEIEIGNPQLTAVEEGYALSADFDIAFNPRLEEVVARGVVLHFVVEFELIRPRWYWFDEKLASRSQTYRLSYHALTRQYRLSTGGLHQSFPNLGDALGVLSRLRHWVVIDRSADPHERPDKPDRAGKPQAHAGETYEAALRLRLDINQLPRPFQISALGNRDWNLVSDWKTWQATLPAAGQ